jgi:hypothetical protein
VGGEQNAAEREPAPPDQDEDHLWDAPVGERPDTATSDVLGLAYRAVKKFPDLAMRHRRFAGTAAIASTGVVLAAAMAIARRLRRGQSPDDILEELTPDEIENAAHVAERQNRWRRLLWRLRLRRQRRQSGDAP